MDKENKKGSVNDRFQFFTMSELETFSDSIEKEEIVEEPKKEKVRDAVIASKVEDSIPLGEVQEVIPSEKEEQDLPSSVEMSEQDTTSFTEEKSTFEEESTEENHFDFAVEAPVESSPTSIAEKVEVEEKKEKLTDEEKKYLRSKVHFSFEARVVIMVVSILFLFIGACILILNVVRNSKGKVISYQESDAVEYEVCLLPNFSSSRECLGEEREYSSAGTDTIRSHFRYQVEFAEEVPYEMSYYVKAYLRIYDFEKTNSVIYKEEDLLFEQTKASAFDKSALVDAKVNVNYQKYYKKVLEYQTDDNIVPADLEIVFYLNESKGAKRISSLLIPLGHPTYRIVKNVIPKTEGNLKITGDFWNQYTITYAVIASILIIICLILLYKTTRLVLKVTTNHTKYRQKLWKILREYDRIIVIARGGYESNFVRDTVKVESFEKLLEIKQNLQKPIIFSRINDVKSEFIVEDEDKIYKFVFKESDV